MDSEIPQTPNTMRTGALADALAKAQAAFPPINKDKTVTVQTRTGGKYTFSYAPLDTILGAVRKPLADNGLAISQLLDDGYLVTYLLHSSGGSLSGRVKLTEGNSVQELGSAITYLRRYALQAMLGIAAEEDDDGNASAGNHVSREEAAEGPRMAPRKTTPTQGRGGHSSVPTQPQIAEFRHLVTEAKLDRVAVIALIHRVLDVPEAEIGTTQSDLLNFIQRLTSDQLGQLITVLAAPPEPAAEEPPSDGDGSYGF